MLVLGRRQFVAIGSGVCMDDTPLLESLALCEPRVNMVLAQARSSLRTKLHTFFHRIPHP